MPRATAERLVYPFHATDHRAVTVGPADTWAAVVSRFPTGWQPDAILLWGGYAGTPEAIWSAPLPVILVANDWPLLWHAYREMLPWCDAVAVDPDGVERFRRLGAEYVMATDLCGLSPSGAVSPPEAPRDIDLVVAGNLSPAVLGERTGWLTPLARLSARWRVAFRSSPLDDPMRQLFRRTRIVLCPGRRPERVAYEREAAAAGAVPVAWPDLPDERLSRETDPLALMVQIDALLRDEAGRAAAAADLTASLPEVTADALSARFLARLTELVPAVRHRAELRRPPVGVSSARVRLHQASSSPPDPTLAQDLSLVARGPVPPADLLTALALLSLREGQPSPAALARAADDLTRVTDAHPGNPVAAQALAEVQFRAGRAGPAVDAARRVLAALDRPADRRFPLRHATFFPGPFDEFRAAWERAAWENAGDEAAETRMKDALLRWRAHRLIARATGDLTHAAESYRQRPDFAASAVGYGLALLRAGYRGEAREPLERATTADPFDPHAPRALADLLAREGDLNGRRRLAYDRRALADVAPEFVPIEDWFAAARPFEDGLTSIVIPCFNQCGYTRQCVESVIRHTRRPYELVLIDNGSIDETAEYFHALAGRPEPDRVAVIRNAVNLGFPAACNQGLRAARGRYLVLLNNDTVVTAGWLDGLIARADDPDRNVGLVGPVSNGAPDDQFVATDYTDADALGRWAARRRVEWAGRTLAVRRLTGFCLLVRRDVLDRIGLLDERFGLGYFDDDDLGFRAADAGYQLAVAQDVFVHHFGGRTFRSLGVNPRDLLRANFDKFRDKWGADRTAAYRELGPPPTAPELEAAAPATPRGRRRVTLSMIVRNEEDNLSDCLRSAADLFDEVVIADTGSTDATRRIIRDFGATLVEFPWVDSFAAARNASLDACTGDWVMWLDADDRLDADNRDRLRAVFAGLGDEVSAYAVKVRSVVDGGRSTRVLDQVRIFPRRPAVRWRYRVHEQILPAVADLGGGTRWTDVAVDHVGYQDPALRVRKLERNLRLLELEATELPDDAFTLFNYGRTLFDLDRTAAALDLFERSLKRCEPGLSIARKLHALIAQAEHQLGRRAESLRACRAGLERYPDDAELLFHEAILHRESRDPAAAELCLVRLLRARQGEYFDMVDADLRGYKARHHLAAVCLELGRPGEAEGQWRSVVAERPDFLAGWLGLAEVALVTGRPADCRAALGHAERLDPKATADTLLTARLATETGRYEDARRTLADAIAREPKRLAPRILFAHAVLREGRDWDEAERCLRDVLAIEPDQAETKRNLEVLLRQRTAGQPNG